MRNVIYLTFAVATFLVGVEAGRLKADPSEALKVENERLKTEVEILQPRVESLEQRVEILEAQFGDMHRSARSVASVK